MTCPDCQAAQTRADHPIYRANCRGCAVRGLANSIQFFRAEKAGRLVPEYQKALQAAFGDGWKQAHQDIKAEATRIKALRAQETMR